jgi:hypothetical protein
MKSIRRFLRRLKTLPDVIKNRRLEKQRKIEAHCFRLAMVAVSGNREKFLRLADELPRQHLTLLYCRLDARIDPWDNLRRDEDGEALNHLLWARDQIWIRLSPLEG